MKKLGFNFFQIWGMRLIHLHIINVEHKLLSSLVKVCHSNSNATRKHFNSCRTVMVFNALLLKIFTCCHIFFALWNKWFGGGRSKNYLHKNKSWTVDNNHNFKTKIFNRKYLLIIILTRIIFMNFLHYKQLSMIYIIFLLKVQ